MDTIQSLLNKIGTIRKHYFEIESLSGENFNIFKVIGLTTEEVRLHSAFLTELLNPKGSHGQKEVFLQLFVSQFEIDNFDCKSAVVKAEHYIKRKSGQGLRAEGGRIDIYIIDAKGNDIIIENKINAIDQTDQLIRYYNYSKSKNNIFYLTKNGGDASESSVPKLGSGDDYYRSISYKEDIIFWLEACKKESVNQPLLREGISHYINLIKHLTNQSTNKAMNKEVVDSILESEESISAANEVLKSFNDVKSIIQKNFWKALIDALQIKGLVIENLAEFNKELGDKVWSFYNKSRNRAKFYGFQILVCSDIENDLSINWQCEIYEAVYSGFVIRKNQQGGISDKPEYAKYRAMVKECDANYSTHKYWLGQQDTNPRLDFMAFNSPEIFSLADDNKLKEIVKGIAEKAFQDIEKLKGLLNNKPIE